MYYEIHTKVVYNHNIPIFSPENHRITCSREYPTEVLTFAIPAEHPAVSRDHQVFRTVSWTDSAGNVPRLSVAHKSRHNCTNYVNEDVSSSLLGPSSAAVWPPMPAPARPSLPHVDRAQGKPPLHVFNCKVSNACFLTRI